MLHAVTVPLPSRGALLSSTPQAAKPSKPVGKSEFKGLGMTAAVDKVLVVTLSDGQTRTLEFTDTSLTVKQAGMCTSNFECESSS